MANPITWRNVNDPAATAAGTGARSNALNSARGAFEGMSQSFTNAVQRQQGIRADNRQNEVDNNTQDFKTLLSQYGSPEELQAAREQGVFQEALDSSGRMIDQDVANQGAVDQRLTGLRTQETAEYNHEQTQQSRADAPLVDRFNAKLASFTADGGIDGIENDFNQLRDNVQGAVREGELSQGAAADVLNRARQNRNTLESQFDAGANRERQEVLDDRADTVFAEDREHTLEGRQRTDAARTLDSQINSAITDATESFDRVEGSVTHGIRELVRNLPEDTTPAQQAEAVRLYEEGVMRAVTPAQGDIERILNPRLAEVDADFNMDGNMFHQSQVASESADDILNEARAGYQMPDEDGNLQFFGLRKASDRRKLSGDITEIVSNGVTIGDDTVPVPKRVLIAALDGIKTPRKWFADKTNSLESEVLNIMDQEWVTTQLGDYRTATEKKNELSNNFHENLLREAGQQGRQEQPTSDAPTEGIDRAGEEANGVDLSAAEMTYEPGPGEVIPEATNSEARYASLNILNEELGRNGVPTASATPTPQPVGQPTADERPGPPPEPLLDRKVVDLIGDGINWLGDKRQQNREGQVDRVRNAPDEDLSTQQFTALLRSNPSAIQQLSAGERNKLRQKYGASLINQYID